MRSIVPAVLLLSLASCENSKPNAMVTICTESADCAPTANDACTDAVTPGSATDGTDTCDISLTISKCDGAVPQNGDIKYFVGTHKPTSEESCRREYVSRPLKLRLPSETTTADKLYVSTCDQQNAVSLHTFHMSGCRISAKPFTPPPPIDALNTVPARQCSRADRHLTTVKICDSANCKALPNAACTSDLQVVNTWRQTSSTRSCGDIYMSIAQCDDAAAAPTVYYYVSTHQPSDDEQCRHEYSGRPLRLRLPSEITTADKLYVSTCVAHPTQQEQHLVSLHTFHVRECQLQSVPF